MKNLLTRIKLSDPITISMILKISVLALAVAKAKVLPTAGDPINADSF